MAAVDNCSGQPEALAAAYLTRSPSRLSTYRRLTAAASVFI